MLKYSFEEKLERADQHLKSLGNEVREWLASEPYSIFDDIDAVTGDNVVRFHTIQSPPSSIAQIVGDCLHNLRCVLDHLIYCLAIANRGTLSDEEATETAFPIFRSPQGFSKRGMGRIRHINPSAQGIIDGLQPYHAGQAATSQWLWLLEKLQNIDKHRALLLTAGLQRGVNMEHPPMPAFNL